MGGNEGKTCLKILVNWLLIGLAAGFWLAAAVTFWEYQNFAGFVGAAIGSAEEIEGEEGRKNDSQQAVIRRALAAALKAENRLEGAPLKEEGTFDKKVGEAWLRECGFRTWTRLGENLMFIVGSCIILFEVIGLFRLLMRKKEQKKRAQRIDGLTEYLLLANRGEAGVLRRREDEFSFLEDEIYKTVMELKSTKEEAVLNHTVLSERIVDIAHQLKTPLTSMSLMTELLEGQQTEEGEECLYRLAVQIHRLQNLVSALLSLAKLESHTIQFEKAKIDVESLIDGAAEPLQGLLQKKNIHLVMSGKPAHILADGRWTEEAIQNVLKNCAEHSPEGGEIQIQWEQNPFYTEIQVTDSGRGISKKDLPHLFERFYRGEDAQKDSAGVGLSLAKLVAEQQDGHIYAENTAKGHARFRMRFYWRD